MEELHCDKCGSHVGWITRSGPRGWVYCDDCKEESDEADQPSALPENPHSTETTPSDPVGAKE